MSNNSGRQAVPAQTGARLLQVIIVGALILLTLTVLTGAAIFMSGRWFPEEAPRAGAAGPPATATSPAALATVDQPTPTAPGTPIAVDPAPTPTPPVVVPTPTPWAENPERLQFAPQVAVLGDGISATINGVSATNCVPGYVAHERLETGYLPIDLVQESGDACQPGEASWELSVDLGQLVAGSHIVEVYITLDGVRTRHAAQLLYVNPEPLPPPQTVPPGSTATPPPTPTPYVENPEGLTFTPPFPAPGEAFEVVVSGEWPSGCVPTLDGVAVAETGYITVLLATPPDALICTGAMTAWRVVAVVEPLPAGSYLVLAEISHAGEITRHAARSLYLPPP